MPFKGSSNRAGTSRTRGTGAFRALDDEPRQTKRRTSTVKVQYSRLESGWIARDRREETNEWVDDEDVGQDNAPNADGDESSSQSSSDDCTNQSEDETMEIHHVDPSPKRKRHRKTRLVSLLALLDLIDC